MSAVWTEISSWHKNHFEVMICSGKVINKWSENKFYFTNCKGCRNYGYADIRILCSILVERQINTRVKVKIIVISRPLFAKVSLHILYNLTYSGINSNFSYESHFNLLRRIFAAHLCRSTWEKVVGGFGKKSSVSTGVRKPGNTYASPTAMIWP